MSFVRRCKTFLQTLCCAATIATAVLPPAGCARISPSPEASVRNDARPAQTRSSTPAPRAPLARKLDAYAGECFGRYSARIEDSRKRYLSWVKDPVAGPTGKEEFVYGLYDVDGDGTDCASAVAAAGALEPSRPALEAGANAYVKALQRTIPAIRGVYGYYRAGEYTSDGMAKGRSAHAGLMKAFEEFRAADEAFAAELNKAEDELLASSFARDDPASKAASDCVMAARKIARSVRGKEIGSVDTAALRPAIDELQRAAEHLRSVRLKPRAGVFLTACEALAASANTLLRRSLANRSFTEDEARQIALGTGAIVEGSIEKVLADYDVVESRKGMLIGVR